MRGSQSRSPKDPIIQTWRLIELRRHYCYILHVPLSNVSSPFILHLPCDSHHSPSSSSFLIVSPLLVSPPLSPLCLLLSRNPDKATEIVVMVIRNLGLQSLVVAIGVVLLLNSLLLMPSSFLLFMVPILNLQIWGLRIYLFQIGKILHF